MKMGFESSLLIFLLFLPVGDANPITEVRKDQVSLECESCRFVATLLHNVWGDSILDNCLAELVLYICEDMQIEDNFMCTGMVGQFKEELIYVFGELIVTPSQVCFLLVNDCGQFYDPFNMTWQLPMPGNKPDPIALPIPNPVSTKLRVLHLTDVHIDYEYEIGAEARCGEKSCCRPANDTNERTIKMPAWAWGTPGCDTPYWTFENMLQHIAAVHTDLDYIVLTGDLMSDAIWGYSVPSHVAHMKNVSTLIHEYLPNIPVYYAVGNHEGIPIDNFAPDWTPPQFHIDGFYEGIIESWGQWLPEEQWDSIRRRGCYMVRPVPGLRILSFLTSMGDPGNYFLWLNQTDPNGVMSWLIDQMVEAEQVGDRVHIIGHIPTGVGAAYESWSTVYYNLVNRFENTIAGQFFGHTHKETFLIYYADPNDFRSRPVSVLHTGPSLGELNPAYRIYTIDGNYNGSSFQVLDFEEHWLNLTQANLEPDNPQWAMLYPSIKAEYGLENMSASSWNDLIERMKTDNALFDKHIRIFYRRLGDHCTGKCKADHLCSLRHAHHNDALCSDLSSSDIVDISADHMKKRNKGWLNLGKVNVVKNEQHHLFSIRQLIERNKREGSRLDFGKKTKKNNKNNDNEHCPL